MQSGLTNLAAANNLPGPRANQRVTLGNANGIETYSFAHGKGNEVVPNPKITVDVNGDPVPATTHSTTTFGAISNSTVTDEFNAIAAGLDVTASASTDNVIVTTLPTGTVVYSRKLHGTGAPKGVTISVDDSGLPVGNEIGATEKVPFIALDSTIQDGINNDAPVGAVAIDPASNQIVVVRTLNGITTFSVPFTVGGVKTTVTVDASGDTAALPSQTTDVFSNLFVAAHDELQQLAKDNGFGGIIKSSHAVTAYDEANGTVVYGISISEHEAGGIHNFAVWVDQDGNPTTLSTDGEIGIVHLANGGIQILRPKISSYDVVDI